MKYIRIQMTENKKHNCPFCNRENNFTFGDVCNHVVKVSAKSIIFYTRTPDAKVETKRLDYRYDPKDKYLAHLTKVLGGI